MARFDWSHDDYDSPTDFEVIPEGTEVKMKATEAEDKETSSGGEMIAATFVIVEPAEYKNRKVWNNFNTVNKSEKAQNFGRRMVAGWARACGKPNAKNTDELLEKAFWCKLGVEKGTGQYRDKNVIASFLMPDGAASSAPTAEKTATDSAPAEKEPAKQESTAPSSGKKKPWDD